MPGKRDALWVGWEATSTPLVALVDSDTIWAADVARQAMMPFADTRMGAVGARQSVLEPRTVWQHLNDMYPDRLTTLVFEGGHRAVLQRSARMRSAFPPDARSFLRQRLRWARNTWCADLRAPGRGWVFRHPFLAFSVIDKAVSPFTALVSFGMALVKIFALATIRTQRRLTRPAAVSARTKEIQRTAAVSVLAAAVIIALPVPSRAQAPEPGRSPAADDIERTIVRMRPDQFQIVTDPGLFTGSPRRHVVVRPDRLELMTGAAVTWSRPFQGRDTALEQIAAALASGPDPTAIAETSPGTYLLQVALTQAPGSRVTFAAPRVREVRLADRPDVYLTGVGAIALFEDVAVTSWNAAEARPGDDPRTLRPFIAYADGSTLRFVNAEVSHLGSDRVNAYGVTWASGSTGEVLNSDFHDNFFGFYTSQARDVVVRDSAFHHNTVYGIDPHTDTNGLVIIGNESYANGSHGIVFSIGVMNGLVRDNHSHDNGGNGIMLDEGSNSAVIEGNVVEHNAADGIVVTHSDQTTVRGNTVRGHRVGVRVHEASKGTRVLGNLIAENARGVEVSDRSSETALSGNVVSGSRRAALVVDAPEVSSSDDVLRGGAVGIETSQRVRVAGVEITGVERGITVAGRGLADVSDARIHATVVGVDGAGELILRDSLVEARDPIDLEARLLPGNDLIVRPPPLVWAGLGMLLAALGLQQVQHQRERANRRRASEYARNAGHTDEHGLVGHGR